MPKAPTTHPDSRWCDVPRSAGTMKGMSSLADVADKDGWVCWICDQPVSRSIAPGTAWGPSVDHVKAKSRGGKRRGPTNERLAHARCNSRRGSADPKLEWPAEYHALDAAPLLPSLRRIERTGTRELVGAFPSDELATGAAHWLEGRARRITTTNWRATIAARAGISIVYLEPDS